MKRIDISEYRIKAPVSKTIKAAFLSDIHGEEFKYITDEVRRFAPDIILIPGDIVNRHDKDPGNGKNFLMECVSIAPTFMSLGNHERNAKANVEKACEECGVVLLEEKSVRYDGLNIGGLTSGYVFQKGRLMQGHFKKTPPPDLKWLKEYSEQSGFKVLLSHHPEYYPRFERDLNIDLILSGHAHGGQWRFFGQPIFAPDQALFPKLAQGFHEGRLIVGRGLANNAPVPRLFNNRELIFICFEVDNELEKQ